MKKSSIFWLVVIVLIIVVGIWYWVSGQSNSGNQNAVAPSNVAPLSAIPSSGSGAPANIIVVGTASTTQLGGFLVAMNGMTLYKYANDAYGTSTCIGQCAVIWPPYTVSSTEASSSLVGMEGADGQVSVITRSDGSDQVTYNGMPLYFYNKDTKVGDVAGQNVGGVWSVVGP